MFLCRQCSVCRKHLKASLCTISEVDREVLFIKNSIFVPKGSRCCKDHLHDKRLRIDALNEICPFKITGIDFSSTNVVTWFNKFREHYNSIRYFDFELPFIMSDIDCYNLTGLSKLNFEDLIKCLADSNIKHSFNRSLRNAVGLFLTKLRLGISKKYLPPFSNFQILKLFLEL